MTLFVVVMLPLVLSLGAWQLRRAEYKQALQDAYFDQLGALPQPLAGQTPPPAFTRVRLRGHYADEHLLLDNQVSNGQPGYWVFTPFVVAGDAAASSFEASTETQGGGTWLVNRGWIPAPRLRSELPEVPSAPPGTLNGIIALVWPDTGLVPLFGAEPLKRLTPRLARLQRLDFAALREELSPRWPDLVAQELRLEAAQPGSLQAVSQTIGFGVERHQGYALQWFGLALALVVGYYFYGRSKTT